MKIRFQREREETELAWLISECRIGGDMKMRGGSIRKWLSVLAIIALSSVNAGDPMLPIGAHINVETRVSTDIDILLEFPDDLTTVRRWGSPKREGNMFTLPVRLKSGESQGTRFAEMRYNIRDLEPGTYWFSVFSGEPEHEGMLPIATTSFVVIDSEPVTAETDVQITQDEDGHSIAAVTVRAPRGHTVPAEFFPFKVSRTENSFTLQTNTITGGSSADPPISELVFHSDLGNLENGSYEITVNVVDRQFARAAFQVGEVEPHVFEFSAQPAVGRIGDTIAVSWLVAGAGSVEIAPFGGDQSTVMGLETFSVQLTEENLKPTDEELRSIRSGEFLFELTASNAQGTTKRLLSIPSIAPLTDVQKSPVAAQAITRFGAYSWTPRAGIWLAPDTYVSKWGEVTEDDEKPNTLFVDLTIGTLPPVLDCITRNPIGMTMHTYGGRRGRPRADPDPWVFEVRVQGETLHSEWIVDQDDSVKITAEFERDLRSPDDPQTVQLTLLQTIFSGDDGGIVSPESFDGNDVVVRGPSGELKVEFVTVEELARGHIASYAVAPRRDQDKWSHLDNGRYDVILKMNELETTKGSRVNQRFLGSFFVELPIPGDAIVENTLSVRSGDSPTKLMFSFQRSVGVDEKFTYGVETSTDLVTWLRIDPESFQMSTSSIANDPAHESVIISIGDSEEAKVPASGFFRVRALTRQ